MRVKLSIYRFDPKTDEKPRYDRFEIDLDAGETVLMALIKVYEELDPSLSFRFACGKVKCGECSIMVNESPCFACNKKIEPEMVIEPLPNLPIIKDLVIDRNKVIHTIFKLAPFLLESTKAAEEIGTPDSQIIDDYIKFTSCYECLICQSMCPIMRKKSDQFIGPLGLLWITQRSLTNTDNWEEKRGAAQMCTNCGKCWEVCPAETKFLEPAISRLLNELKPDRRRRRT